MERKTEDSLFAELCRNADASENHGFDGKEHPEKRALVKAIINALYPIELRHLVDLINGDVQLVRVRNLGAGS